MSLENAKKLALELNTDRELREKFVRGPEAALAEKDYGCTPEELKEALILSRELDTDELGAVTGGTAFTANEPGKDYDECGGCYSTFFAEDCAATVEDGSSCWTDDRCMIWDVVYNVRCESVQRLE